MLTTTRRAVIVALLTLAPLACSSDESNPAADAQQAGDDAADTVGDATTGAADSAENPDGNVSDTSQNPDGTDTFEPSPLLASYELPGDSAYPEGVTFDPVSRRFFTGSMLLGNVLATDADGTSSEFFAGNDDGEEWLILGLEADPERRRLWVCAAYTRDLAASEVWVLDLDTGERLWQKSLEDVHVGAACTDMIIADGGDAYVCDRENPNLYHLDFDAKTATLLSDDPALGSEVIGQNGIAFTPDRQNLVSVIFAPGALMKISLTDPPVVSEIALSGVDDLFGIDAVVVHDGIVYMVTDSQLIRAVPNAEWTSAAATAYPLNSGGYSGLTIAEGALYASKSEVTKFAFSAAPDLPFVLSRVELTVFDE